MASRTSDTLRTKSALSVNVADLVARPGSTKRVKLEGHLDGLNLQLAHVPPDSPLGLDLRLDAIVEGIAVTGSVSSTVSVECRRCLATTGTDLLVAVNELYSLPGQPHAEEGYSLRGDDLDLEPMIRDVLLLAMPLNPLCREECRGLCSVCGQDLNARDCGHRPEPDVRWQPLRGLKETLGKTKED